MDAERTLIIILSVTLTVFLLVGIAVGLQLFKVSKKLQNIADKANDITDNFVSVSETIKNAAKPAAITALVANVVKKFKTKGKK